MTPDAAPTIPTYAHWPAPAAVAAQLGVSHIVVLGWIVQGVKTETGRIRLPAVKLGGRWKIDPEAVGPFVQRMTANSLGEGPDAAPPMPSAARAKKRVKQCLDRLRAQGVIGGGEGAPHSLVNTRGKRRRAHRHE